MKPIYSYRLDKDKESAEFGYIARSLKLAGCCGKGLTEDEAVEKLAINETLSLQEVSLHNDASENMVEIMIGSKLRTYEKFMINNSEACVEAEKIMCSISDAEHSIGHMQDVLHYTKRLVGELHDLTEFEINVCLMCAYWHDVGRSVSNEGHEQISAKMLGEYLSRLGCYSSNFILCCKNAILTHKWNMEPATKCGNILKDADKLAFLGKNRWEQCLDEGKPLNDIVYLLPNLRNNILYFEQSREMYDVEVIKIFELLYNYINIKEN